MVEKGPQTSAESQHSPMYWGTPRCGPILFCVHPRHCTFLGEKKTEAEKSTTLSKFPPSVSGGAGIPEDWRRFWGILESGFVLFSKPSTSSQET